jgi:ornithine cyclodeaminase/alanine dehydrogenase
VIDILREASDGGAEGGLKAEVIAATGTYFHGLPAVSAKCRMAALKWAAVAPPVPGRASVSATILLSDIETGAPIAVMDAGWLTLARTGALTAIAAEALAPAVCRTVGFVGAGAQARSNLEALLEVRPDLQAVTIFDRFAESGQSFAHWAEGHGLAVRLVSEPALAVREQDIVVSTVPAAGLTEPFLDAAWLAEDSFVSMVDLGRSWKRESLGALHLVSTDDVPQSVALAENGKLAYRGPFAYTLADFAVGRRPTERRGRNALIFGGIGLADLATAALVWRRLNHSPN